MRSTQRRVHSLTRSPCLSRNLFQPSLTVKSSFAGRGMYMLQSIKRDAGQANYRNRKAVTLALKGRYVHKAAGFEFQGAEVAEGAQFSREVKGDEIPGGVGMSQEGPEGRVMRHRGGFFHAPVLSVQKRPAYHTGRSDSVTALRILPAEFSPRPWTLPANLK